MVTRTNRSPPGSPEALHGAILYAAVAVVTWGCVGKTVREPDAERPPPEQCNGYDDDLDGQIDEVPCPERYWCPLDECQCATSHTRCGHQCFAHFNDDPGNCGACGRQCAEGMDCVEGRCVCNGLVCGAGYVPSDERNCGACGRRCAHGMICRQDSCRCNALICNGVCTPYDEQNCGACGRRCPAGAICMPTSVLPCQCPRPSLPCGPDGACVGFDDNNCGACGSRCPPGTHCKGGSCG